MIRRVLARISPGSRAAAPPNPQSGARIASAASSHRRPGSPSRWPRAARWSARCCAPAAESVEQLVEPHAVVGEQRHERRDAGDLGDGQVQARVEPAVVARVRRRGRRPAAPTASRARGGQACAPPPSGPHRPRGSRAGRSTSSISLAGDPCRVRAAAPAAGRRRTCRRSDRAWRPGSRRRRAPDRLAHGVAADPEERSASSRSDGSDSPGATRPSRMVCSSRATVSSNALPSRTGRSSASLAWYADPASAGHLTQRVVELTAG